ncbi:MAG: glycosyltransferase [Balneolales bacterium]
MKVLHFKTTYLNLSETFINRLVRNHVDFNPVIATAYKSKYCQGLNIYEMPSTGLSAQLNRIYLMLNQSPPFLKQVIRNEKPDVIHGHFGLDSYRLLGAASQMKVPLIVHFYGHDVIRLPKEFGWKARYKRLRKRANFFITVSDDMKRNIIEMGFPEARIETVKLGLDMNMIQFKHRTSSKTNLMMIGRMVEKKGFKYAIEAVSLIKQSNVPVHLDIYGDGPLKNSLYKLCKKLDVVNEVTFNGNTENEQILKELYQHDVLLAPSVQAADGDREGMPHAIVEGLASGIPMIGSTHAGIPELILHEKTGLLTQEKNSEAIARAVIRLQNDSGLVSHISKKGREKVEKEHCINKITRQTEKIYHRVIKEYANDLD